MKWLKRTLIILVALGALGYLAYQLVTLLPQFGGEPEGSRLGRVKASPEYSGGRFENTPPQSKNDEFIKTIKFYIQGQVREPASDIPVIDITSYELAQPPDSGLSAIWLGHASVLVEINGVRLLSDPVLSDRVSPLPIGPTRLHRAPIKMEDLRGIDAVLISHDHYDHLDMPTTKALAQKGTQFFVPLGIGAHLERWEVQPEQIHEMEWWQSVDFKGITINCTPARHYSGRKKMDNSTLWSSWFVKGPKNSFYFSGDTGYAPHFREIQNRLGTPNMTLMKVGAYGEPESWNDIHMNPEDAIKAQMDLGAEILLPVHWATFDLAYHAWSEPILRTLEAASGKPVTVATPRVGERFTYGAPFTNMEWYTDL